MGLALQTAVPADGSYLTKGAKDVDGRERDRGRRDRSAVEVRARPADRARGESTFPWSTFAINVTGCVLVGFLIAAIVDRHSAPEWLRAGLVVGLCGGYTTFSTFAQETLDLIEARDMAFAALSVSGNVVLGVLAVMAGARLGRLT